MGVLTELRDLWSGARDFYHWIEDQAIEWFVGEGAWMTAEQTPSCPVGSSEHAAADRHGRPTGHLLCEGHFDRLAKMLREIEKEVDDLDAAPSIAIKWNTGGGGHSGGGAPAFEQAPAHLNPLVLGDRRQGTGASEDPVEAHAGGGLEPALVVLAEYADRVRAERILGWPAETFEDCVDRMPGTPRHGPAIGLPCQHHGCRGITWTRTAPIPATVKSERTLLSRHLEWVARWVPTDDHKYGAADVFARLRGLLGALRAANGVAQQSLGKCPVDRDGGARCTGKLWPFKPTHTVGEWTGTTPDAVRCNDCDAKWVGPAELARLALILDKQRQPKTAPAAPGVSEPFMHKVNAR